jgi:transposase
VSMTEHSPKIEVITSVHRRRRWSGPEKMRMVEETYEPGATVSLVARRNGVAPNQLFTWRRLAAQGGLTAATAGEEVVPASEHRGLQRQVRELHRLLGKKTLEVEILKEVLDQAGPKKDCCCARRLSVPAVPDERDYRSGRHCSLEPRRPNETISPTTERAPSAAR